MAKLLRELEPATLDELQTRIGAAAAGREAGGGSAAAEALALEWRSALTGEASGKDGQVRRETLQYQRVKRITRAGARVAGTTDGRGQAKGRPGETHDPGCKVSSKAATKCG